MQIKTLDTGENLRIQDGFIQSINPPESLFGFTYWSYMIPPVKPEKMLILGYGNGTIASLTRMIWGDGIRIQGIDIKQTELPRQILMVDAYEYVLNIHKYHVNSNIKYDYTVVDLYNGKKICDFVFDEEFVKKLSSICIGRLSINLFEEYFGQEKVYENYFKRELEKNILKNRIVFFKK